MGDGIDLQDPKVTDRKYHYQISYISIAELEIWVFRMTVFHCKCINYKLYLIIKITFNPETENRWLTPLLQITNC